MIIFEKIRYRNLISSGNAWNEVDITATNSTLIVGKNGHGKSTICDALCYALFNRPYRKINKPQLINSINKKNLEVEVDFKIAKTKYKIRRGMSPSFFEIYRNGVLIDQSSKNKDYQKYLEENILKMNYKTFGQIIVLSSSIFVPFMQLSSFNRREIIEDLLDLNIFSEMNNILKSKLISKKDDIKQLEYESSLCHEKIKLAESHNESIKRLSKNRELNIKNDIKKTIHLVEECDQNIIALKKAISEETAKKHKVESLEHINKDILLLKSIIDNTNSEIKFYEDNHLCSSCGQVISEEHKAKKHNELLDKLENVRTKLDEKLEVKKALQKKIEENAEIDEKISKLNEDVYYNSATKNGLMDQLKKYKKELADHKELMGELQDVESLKLNKIRIEEKIEKEKNIYQIMCILQKMLKDSGVKTKIIKQYIPIINTFINKYLSDMDFFVDFKFDESFNEEIRSRHRDSFSYSSFSEGEKSRIDLALLLTWRSISKLRNSVSSNLLILDEIFDGSLDSNGTQNLLDILNDIVKKNSNVIVISHKTDQMLDKFDRVIVAEKINNFSQLKRMD